MFLSFMAEKYLFFSKEIQQKISKNYKEKKNQSTLRMI